MLGISIINMANGLGYTRKKCSAANSTQKSEKLHNQNPVPKVHIPSRTHNLPVGMALKAIAEDMLVWTAA